MSDRLHSTEKTVFNLENRMCSNAVLLSHLSHVIPYGQEDLRNIAISTIVIANVGVKVKYFLGHTQKWLVKLDSFSPIFYVNNLVLFSQTEKKKTLQRKTQRK